MQCRWFSDPKQGQIGQYSREYTDLVSEEAFGQRPVIDLIPLVVEAAVHQLTNIAVDGKTIRDILSLQQVGQYKVIAVSRKHCPYLQNFYEIKKNINKAQQHNHMIMRATHCLQGNFLSDNFISPFYIMKLFCLKFTHLKVHLAYVLRWNRGKNNYFFSHI